MVGPGRNEEIKSRLVIVQISSSSKRGEESGLLLVKSGDEIGNIEARGNEV